MILTPRVIEPLCSSFPAHSECVCVCVCMLLRGAVCQCCVLMCSSPQWRLPPLKHLPAAGPRSCGLRWSTSASLWSRTDRQFSWRRSGPVVWEVKMTLGEIQLISLSVFLCFCCWTEPEGRLSSGPAGGWQMKYSADKYCSKKSSYWLSKKSQ